MAHLSKKILYNSVYSINESAQFVVSVNFPPKVLLGGNIKVLE